MYEVRPEDNGKRLKEFNEGCGQYMTVIHDTKSGNLIEVFLWNDKTNAVSYVKEHYPKKYGYTSTVVKRMVV